ncbi:hypothetical protein CONLIGDRAFT_633410 [Coniochaeta ligniaria NRRL 30616]|uniref:Fe2OG dioxygenase domain-containing protein n=1 Tax=Coniochaeta ligniaria NRRL 30616 TaxID=1408157 RepID=A0A1J7JHN0_9PEZI|nr:hypothetical protein CONLIGDRAFT_633410 [Coniochaeta ligniaria NRRL 30616]
MFNINAFALPTLRTRQALLILDLQNDFVSPDGALTINQPDVIVSRILQLAKVFRLSGAGDVIWIRSQYDAHRPLSGAADGGDQIITTDAPVVPRRTSSSRGRPPTSGRHEEAVMEADEEAFLSYPPGCEKRQCVRPGSDGAQLLAEVQQAVDPGRDITFTKTHYSAFAAGQQLVQLLRGRFVTEIYVCGALTNISIYATALDAGRHGYDITLVDDCCGYRSDMRHSNAVHRLMQLTGCEVMTSSDIITKLKPEKPSSADKAKRRSRGRENMSGTSPTSRETVGPDSGSKERGVGQTFPEDEDDVSKALPLSFEKLTLSDESPSAPVESPGSHARPHRQNPSPTAQQPLQSVVESRNIGSPPRITPPATTASPGHRIHYVDSAPLEADPDLSAEPTSSDGVHSDDARKRELVDINQRLSYLRSNKATRPPRVLIPANSSLAAGSAARSAAAKAKMRSRQPPNNEPAPSSNASGVAESKDDKEPTQPTQLETDEQQSRTDSNPTASEPLCEGDTTIIGNLLPPSLAATAFERLKSEVAWQRMSHQGGEVPRLVAVQGEVDDDGNMPAYRHPSDESPPLLPFSPTVTEIKAEVEKQVGHPLNHVLIQFYRDGNDYISEHSDKTLDIARGSFIANVSLGAERTMVFRTKRLDKDPSRKREEATATATSNLADGDATPTPGETSPETPQPRRIERARLPHNSLCRMGLATNMRWLHAIRQDKRLDRDKSEAELASGGQRISLTFRQIGTFIDKTQSHIWGQGAVAKSRAAARPVLNGQTPEAVAMLRAFGAENHASEFEWGRYYGAGFDVLNIKAAPRLFASADSVVNMRIAMMLADLGLSYAKGSTGAGGLGNEAAVKFVDNDAAKSTVEGHMAVMLYLDAVYGGSRRNEPPVPQDELARRLTRFQAALGLLEKWRACLGSLADQGEASSVPPDGPSSRERLAALEREMDVWDKYAREATTAAADDESSAPSYIAGGGRPSIADFALWPVLHDIMVTRPGVINPRCKNLVGYYSRLKESKAGVKVLGGGEVEDKSADEPRG